MELLKLIDIIEDKCVNCHQCIAVCPVKFANNGSDKVIHVNHNLCIGCGQCVKACTHDARIFIDDFDLAFSDLKDKKHKIIAIAAPAVVSNFADTYLNLNGWLLSLGVEAIFDVSFGAELTVKSYVEFIKTNNPKTVIAQPCPAIVSYIQIYKPNLLPFLAPADSPMMHTMKMVKEFYPQFSNHKILVISPCIAKRREFKEVGIGDYNVTITNISSYLENENINLKDFPEVDYYNDSAERAVLFSSPGGLLETAERELPGIRNKTRKIEGVCYIYNYINHVEESIENGFNPILIDCLNCELGCNGGTGTLNSEKSHDEMEFLINQRKEKLQKQYNTAENNENSIKELRNIINKYWKKDLYNRKYINHSSNFTDIIITPSKSQLDDIYVSMHKTKKEDIKNCSSCGYNSCEEMAKAIFNGFNKKENCHFYLDFENKEYSKELDNKVKIRTEEIENTNKKINIQKEEIIKNSEDLLRIIAKIQAIIN